LNHAHRVDDVVTRTVAVGNNALIAVAVGATTLTVGAGTSFAIASALEASPGAAGTRKR